MRVSPETFELFQFIIERSPEAMADALERIHTDRDLLPRLGAENLDEITPWDWKLRFIDYEDYSCELLSANMGSPK